MRSAEKVDIVVAATSDRCLATTLLLLCIAAIATAAWLQPDSRGYGTHTQLHLLPCAFKTITGLPCPACGLTTSMAYMARANVIGAFNANPFGIIAFLIVALLAFFSTQSLLRNRPVTPMLKRFFNNKVFAGIVICFIVSWFFNLMRCLGSV